MLGSPPRSQGTAPVEIYKQASQEMYSPPSPTLKRISARPSPVLRTISPTNKTNSLPTTETETATDTPHRPSAPLSPNPHSPRSNARDHRSAARARPLANIRPEAHIVIESAPPVSPRFQLQMQIPLKLEAELQVHTPALGPQTSDELRTVLKYSLARLAESRPSSPCAFLAPMPSRTSPQERPNRAAPHELCSTIYPSVCQAPQNSMAPPPCAVESHHQLQHNSVHSHCSHREG